jgi:thiamine-phosphate pyrophosphorylase
MRSVGIGGITLANAQQVIDAGADAIAVVQALFASQQAQSIQAQAQQFCLLFS